MRQSCDLEEIARKRSRADDFGICAKAVSSACFSGVFRVKQVVCPRLDPVASSRPTHPALPAGGRPRRMRARASPSGVRRRPDLERRRAPEQQLEQQQQLGRQRRHFAPRFAVLRRHQRVDEQQQHRRGHPVQRAHVQLRRGHVHPRRQLDQAGRQRHEQLDGHPDDQLRHGTGGRRPDVQRRERGPRAERLDLGKSGHREDGRGHAVAGRRQHLLGRDDDQRRHRRRGQLARAGNRGR